jgi:hypothetical protein
MSLHHSCYHEATVRYVSVFVAKCSRYCYLSIFLFQVTVAILDVIGVSNIKEETIFLSVNFLQLFIRETLQIYENGNKMFVISLVALLNLIYDSI